MLVLQWRQLPHRPQIARDGGFYRNDLASTWLDMCEKEEESRERYRTPKTPPVACVVSHEHVILLSGNRVNCLQFIDVTQICEPHSPREWENISQDEYIDIVIPQAGVGLFGT